MVHAPVQGLISSLLRGLSTLAMSNRLHLICIDMVARTPTGRLTMASDSLDDSLVSVRDQTCLHLHTSTPRQMGLSEGQAKMGQCACISCFSQSLGGRTRLPASPGQRQYFQAEASAFPLMDSHCIMIPFSLSLSLTHSLPLSLSLSPPLHQVSFYWKSLVCWKRRRWRRRQHAWTAGSLTSSSAQRTC